MSKSRSGAPKRVAVGLLAGALTVFGIALAPALAGETDDVAMHHAGVNRYSTAAATAGQDDFAGATVAILATGENFPDALVASGRAGAHALATTRLAGGNRYETAVSATNAVRSASGVNFPNAYAGVRHDRPSDGNGVLAVRLLSAALVALALATRIVLRRRNFESGPRAMPMRQLAADLARMCRLERRIQLPSIALSA